MERRLLLINPAHTLYGQQHRSLNLFPVPPLGLGYVAALTPPGWTIRIIDENLRSVDGAAWAPSLVGITCLTPTAPRAYSLAAEYRARGATVVLAGMHASLLPEEAAGYADSVVVGDAEPVWSRLVSDFEKGELKSRYQGEIIPLDGLPVPRRDLYPRGYFTETAITSRGCTNACEFCSVWRFYNRRYRTRPIDEVVDELDGLPRNRIVFLADDNLTLNRQRTIVLCQRMVERGVRRRYFIQASLGLSDDAELLRWLTRSGCLYVSIGLESLATEALARIGKPDLLRVGAEGYRDRIARIHKHRLAVVGSFIVGLDEDTPATFERLRAFILATGIDCAVINILHPLPGALLWDRMRDEGRLLYTGFPADYALYSQNNVSFRPKGMSPAELQEGTRWLIASLTRLPVTLRRAWRTWRSTRDPFASCVSLAWNWQTFRALGSFPIRDVREEP